MPRSPISKSAAWLATVVFGAVVGTLAGAVPGGSRVHATFGDAPPVSHTGGFSEPNCRACHWENPLNDGGVAIEVQGLPLQYDPDSLYLVSVTLRREEMKVAGFQMAARIDSEGERKGAQGGTFRAVDPRVSLTRNDTNGVTYAGHTRSGTALTYPGAAVWSVEWRAPSAGVGPVVFHIAANAADDNNSEGGDYVYVTSVRVTPADPKRTYTPR